MTSSRVLAFDDPDEYMSAIRAAQVEVIPTRTGTFHGELMQMNLPRLWLQRGSENLPGIVRTTVGMERVAIGFLADANQPAIRHAGAEMQVGDLLHCDWQSTHRRTDAPCRWASMSLTRHDFADIGRTLFGRELPAPPAWRLLRPHPRAMARLLAIHQWADRIARVTSAHSLHPEIARGLEHALLNAMVACLTDGLPVGVGRGTVRRGVVIDRLEAFLAAHHASPIYLAELCAAVGVSARTLRAFCHEQFGMGPIRFLWLRRMHLARRELGRATPGTATVTDIATGHGFWEFGRFSVEYRTLFGESPSETLRQPALHRPTRRVEAEFVS